MSTGSRINLLLILTLSTVLAYFALNELQHLPPEQLQTDHAHNLNILGYASAVVAALSGIGVVAFSW